jgi:hypothetical protein
VIAGRHNPSRFAFDHCLARAADVGGDDGASSNHVFDDRVREPFTGF